MRQRTAQFVRAEVWRPALVAIVDIRQDHAGIDRFRGRRQPQIVDLDVKLCLCRDGRLPTRQERLRGVDAYGVPVHGRPFSGVLQRTVPDAVPLQENSPLAAEAVEVIAVYRSHPRWRLIGFPSENRPLHDALWKKAAAKTFAFRRLYDVRTALTMVAQGVTEFATANVKDFEDAGFRKVWNPLAD